MSMSYYHYCNPSMTSFLESCLRFSIWTKREDLRILNLVKLGFWWVKWVHLALLSPFPLLAKNQHHRRGSSPHTQMKLLSIHTCVCLKLTNTTQIANMLLHYIGPLRTQDSVRSEENIITTPIIPKAHHLYIEPSALTETYRDPCLMDL